MSQYRHCWQFVNPHFLRMWWNDIWCQWTEWELLSRSKPLLSLIKSFLCWIECLNLSFSNIIMLTLHCLWNYCFCDCSCYHVWQFIRVFVEESVHVKSFLCMKLHFWDYLNGMSCFLSTISKRLPMLLTFIILPPIFASRNFCIKLKTFNCCHF